MVKISGSAAADMCIKEQETNKTIFIRTKYVYKVLTINVMYFTLSS